MCAPREFAGFESGLRFQLARTDCSLSGPTPDGGVLLDDVRFTTDPSCP